MEHKKLDITPITAKRLKSMKDMGDVEYALSIHKKLVSLPIYIENLRLKMRIEFDYIDVEAQVKQSVKTYLKWAEISCIKDNHILHNSIILKSIGNIARNSELLRLYAIFDIYCNHEFDMKKDYIEIVKLYVRDFCIKFPIGEKALCDILFSKIIA